MLEKIKALFRRERVLSIIFFENEQLSDYRATSSTAVIEDFLIKKAILIICGSSNSTQNLGYALWHNKTLVYCNKITSANTFSIEKELFLSGINAKGEWQFVISNFEKTDANRIFYAAVVLVGK